MLKRIGDKVRLNLELNEDELLFINVENRRRCDRSSKFSKLLQCMEDKIQESLNESGGSSLIQVDDAC